MIDFIVERLAMLRGYRSDDPLWLEHFKGLHDHIVRLIGVDNPLDLFMLGIEDGAGFDDRLNEAWYAAVHDQAEREYDYQDMDYDPYDYYYGSDDWPMSVEAVWAEEDRRCEEAESKQDVDEEYRYFVRRYNNVWRAGHERRRLRQAG